MAVAAFELEVFHPALEFAADGGAVGEPDDVSWAGFVEEFEEFEVFSDAPVVAAAGFFELAFVGFEFFGGFEEGAVDALELGVFFGAAPVGAGDGSEFEGADFSGVVDVAAFAEVGEVSVGALGDGAVLEVGKEVELEGLVLPALEGFLAGDLGHLEGEASGDALAHAVFEPLKVFGGEGAGEAEVVVEAGVDGGADAEFGIGEELEHGFGEQVCGGVAHACEPLFSGEGGEVDVGFERRGHGVSPGR